MNPILLVLLSVVFGIVLGAGAVIGVSAMRAMHRKQQEMSHPPIPTAATEVLDQLHEPAFLLNIALNPVHTNPAAHSDTVWLRRLPLADTEFMNSMRRVMDTGETFILNPEDNNDIKITAFKVSRSFVAVIVEDIGEQKRLDAMRRDFVANVSHEFKTPIAAITLLAEAINQASDDAELVNNFSSKLVKESERLGDLSRDIIHLSRAQSDLAPAQKVPVKITNIIDYAVQKHSNFAETKQVEIIVSSLESTVPKVLGDEEALDIAFSNILSNAIRFSPDGGRIGVGISVTEENVKISVTDQGPGISKTDQQRVFERFYRADTSRNRASGGTGLGLSIAKHTAMAHGGHIDLWSEIGHGSTFTMVLPLLVRDNKKDENARKAKKRFSKTQKEVKASLSNVTR